MTFKIGFYIGSRKLLLVVYESGGNESWEWFRLISVLAMFEGSLVS